MSAGNDYKKDKLQISENEQNIKQNDLPKGWIIKRCKRRNKWKKAYFAFSQDELIYGQSEEALVKNVPLKNAQIKECTKDDKENVLSIETNSRTFYLSFDSEEIRDEWLQALFTIKVIACKRLDNSQACIIQ
ncbi:DgyrCDS8483 [Dimorphilus gyrociliatus]|uniref:DgyrCDS8483 n=1 Tax=Dimorphilus gyrociliatus TaxID=2664684 RepID=A0A7I8VUC1_9ANNE|nr:DgyrCDS8483 [Dimorphilus gyrociliatus]